MLRYRPDALSSDEDLFPVQRWKQRCVETTVVRHGEEGVPDVREPFDHPLFEELAAEQLQQPEVGRRRMFSHEGLHVNGKFFAFLDGDRLALKLPSARRNLSTPLRQLGSFNYRAMATSCWGGLIQTAVGSSGGCGVTRTKRSGWAA